MAFAKSDHGLPYRMQLMRNGARLYSITTAEKTEIGRRQTHELPEPSIQRTESGEQRFVVAAIELRGFPRQLMRVERESQGQLRVENLHRQASVKIANVGTIGPLQSQVATLPVTLVLPEGFILEIEDASPTSLPRKLEPIVRPKRELKNEVWEHTMNSLCIPELAGSQMLAKSSAGLGSTHDFSISRLFQDSAGVGKQAASNVLSWIELALAAMQRPASSSEFYAGIAEAVASIIEVDRAEVILWDGMQWQRDPNRSFVHPDIQELQAPSNALLNRARTTRKITVHPEPTVFQRLDMSESVQHLHAAVACPILDIFGGGEDILGVLYADRQTGSARRSNQVLETEQKLIAILATAIASSIAKERREKLVTKYEQFFSNKVTQAISQNPALLDGEDANITVLFCDIRRFSLETDRIGPAAAMNWVSDTLSELSERVLQFDGVLVDYVGDEMFAMWGAPEKTADHAFKAASAAQLMIRLRKTLSQKYKDLLPKGVDFGIGMCSGTARVGNTGSKQKFKYGPLGRTVNLGSRLQGLTKQWNVCCIMDEATERDLSNQFLRRRLCTAQVVGMDGATPIFELMPENDSYHLDLVHAYTNALDLFESGKHPREAAQAFGKLAKEYPEDGPSLIMLVRAVNELAQPSSPFNPVWSALSK